MEETFQETDVVVELNTPEETQPKKKYQKRKTKIFTELELEQQRKDAEMLLLEKQKQKHLKDALKKENAIKAGLIRRTALSDAKKKAELFDKYLDGDLDDALLKQHGYKRKIVVKEQAQIQQVDYKNFNPFDALRR